MLRCGGGVKFKNPEKWIWDYNAIPDGPKGRLALEAINAKGISVTTGGLQHFGNYMLDSCPAFILMICWHNCLYVKLPRFQLAKVIVLPFILRHKKE